eukprot:6239513-Lingulodinium_polyedra.AAC.1
MSCWRHWQGNRQTSHAPAIGNARRLYPSACVISGYCRQPWQGCRLLPLPRRRAMRARSAQSQ